MKFVRIIAVLLCAVMAFSCSGFSVFAYTKTEVQQEIDRLEKENAQIKNEINQLKNDRTKQQQLKEALDRQIANVQSQISVCNKKISETNALIAENEAEIARQQKEMNQTIYEYKKRIRAIYMSGNLGSGVEILLGAETLADFLTLSQASLNISRRDKQMIDDIAEQISYVEAKTAQNQVLIEEQKELKATLNGKQAELDAEVAEVLKVIGSINSDISAGNSEISQNQKDLKAWEAEMQKLNTPPIDTRPFDGLFTWPVPGYTNRTSEYGPRWNKNHAGIDISQGGIANAKVVAIASGTVHVWCSTCTHNYGKYSNGSIYSCGCGGGYGNYLSIDHGTYKGVAYRSVYAHLAPGSITVSTGTKVGKGQVIGKVGTTGRSSGYHLHFEIRQNGSPVNPMNFY